MSNAETRWFDGVFLDFMQVILTWYPIHCFSSSLGDRRRSNTTADMRQIQCNTCSYIQVV